MDLDETMTTSTSSSPPASSHPDNNEDDLFPQSASSASNAPRTPIPPNEHLNDAAAPGELSPPGSQGHENDHHHQPAFNEANTSSRRLRSAGFGNQRTAGSANPSSSSATAASASFVEDSREGGAGWGWKNKKAQEEMSRAWDNVVDRDFSLKEYGDVMMKATKVDEEGLFAS
ncbi:hypothetical protein PV08_02684 [Exophiala spinifera]|uniref:Uncharacterized protein n=1 Tax=Exophiala spinifera TaxID=91928 RepID=A0A0D1YSX6_9EURO|nr:uncharacterized protein PV08_02684 [Exophiala spinifera]KIW18396.1 hypothetical protein PV08_02684 [Exophiala spinifera]